MTTISEPNVTVNIQGASSLVQNTSQRVLMVGQVPSGAVAPSGVLVQNFPNDNSEDSLFGANSMLTNLIKAFKTLNSITRLDVLPIADDGAGTPGTGEFSFTGTATEDGSYTVTYGSALTGQVDLDVLEGDTAADIATALTAALNALPNILGTAVDSAGTVEMTAANAGNVGAFYSLRIEGSVAGITASVSQTGGASNDPDATGLLDAIEGERYQTIVWGHQLDPEILVDFLDARWNVTNDIQDGVGIIGYADSVSSIYTELANYNSQSLVMPCDLAVDETQWSGSASQVPEQVLAACLAAVRALRLTAGANITSLLSGAVGRDSSGGPALSSRPYFNTPLSNLPVIPQGYGFTAVEMENIKALGGTILGNNRARNTIILGEVVTTYKTDIAGNPDDSFKFLNYVDTAVNAREFFWNNFKSEYAQSRLSPGDLVEGRPMQNEASILGFCALLFTVLSQSDYVLTAAGEDALNSFKDNTIISIDYGAGLVTLLFNSFPIVTQLRTIDSTIKISFAI